MGLVIVCVCANPAIDTTYRVPLVRLGHSHAVADVARRAGGKAVNVARILHALGEDVLLITFNGGTNSEFFASDLATAGIPTRFVERKASTRTSVTIVDDAEASVFNEVGEAVTSEEWDALLTAVRESLQSGDVLAVSGSLPPALATNAYAQLVQIARERGALSLVDAYGDVMRKALAAGPTVGKCNLSEAKGLLDADASAVDLARKMHALGAESVVLTLGDDGAIGLEDGRAVRVRSTTPVSGNPTGAGDSMSAALCAALAHGEALRLALPRAAALAAATVAAPVAGDYLPEVFREQLQHQSIEEI